MWIVPAALVVLGVGAFLLFGGGGGGGILSSGSDETIPAFDFSQGRTTAVSVKAEEKKQVPASAKTAATGITSTLDTLYTEAFLDPANWREGSYDEVWPLFADSAAGAAQQDGATLTAGTGGDALTTIAKPKGRIQVKVLLNDNNAVATAVAIVRFSAVGTRKDGQLMLFHSSGQYFLQHGGDGWQVYSFSVRRNDQLREPKPSASAESGASAVSS